MENEAGAQSLHSLIPLEDFKVLLGVDDREDCLHYASVRNVGSEFLRSKNSGSFPLPSLAAFCLTTATYTIEHYCKRRLVWKRHHERVESGPLLLLSEYPVREVLALYREERGFRNEEYGDLVEPDFYRLVPDCGADVDFPFFLSLSPALLRLPGISAFKVIYAAGYECGEAPSDLASACFELAAWNMARYRGRRIGITGNVRGSGRDGEHLEASMPENVRVLLEPYKRRVI